MSFQLMYLHVHPGYPVRVVIIILSIASVSVTNFQLHFLFVTTPHKLRHKPLHQGNLEFL